MAEGFKVYGPCKIEVCLAGDDGTYVTLGHSDNSDMWSFEEDDHFTVHTSNETGDMSAEVVLQGSTGTLAGSLITWDEAVLDGLRARLRLGTVDGATPGKFAQVGKLVVADSRFISLKLTTTRVGLKSYKMKRMWMPRPFVQRDMGNIGTRGICVFATLPFTTGGANSFWDFTTNA